jgi:mannose-1-phosphate guanylyltransferase
LVNLKALILSAGFGKRLKSLTKTTPKCLIKIKGMPILVYWFKKLQFLEIDNILVNTHYLSHKVESVVKNYQNELNINLVYEKNLLGTAGTLKKNISFFNNSDGALVIHCDNYTNDDLRGFIKFINKNKKYICIFAFYTSKPLECGILEIDKNNFVKNIYEKNSDKNGNLANGAIYYFPKKILDNMKFQKKNIGEDIVNDILYDFIGNIKCYKTSNFFIDIGNIENLKLAKKNEQ